ISSFKGAFLFAEIRGGDGMSEETLHPESMAQIASELNIKQTQVKNVLQVLQEGNTVPFIARYRKELTGGLDEVVLREISENWTYAVNLDNRKQEVIRLIDEQGKLTDELKIAIEKS